MRIIFQLSCILLISFLFKNLNAQDLTITAYLKDKSSGSSIPYVNIGFSGTRTGTTSDSAGNFKLSIPEKHKNDTISFLAVGYKPLRLSVKQLEQLQSNSVILEKKIYELKEVSVKAKKRKETKLGINKGQTNYYTGVGYSGTILSSYFEPIQTEKSYFIKSLRFYGYGWQDNPKLRIRIQKKDSIYNIPGEDVTAENIIISPKVKWGWMEFDLSEHNIYIEKGGFFVTLELLEHVPKFIEVNGKKLHDGYTIGIKKMKKKPLYSIHKSTYFSNWEEEARSHMIGVTILE